MLIDTRYSIVQRSSADAEFKKLGAQVFKLWPTAAS
jgi:hypothetical protein